MRYFFLIISLTVVTLTHAQFLDKTAVNIGYEYLGRNSLSLGFEYNFEIDDKDWQGFSTGINARYFKGKDNKQYIIPEIGVSYRNMAFMQRINVSTEHLNPNIGLNLMNAIWIYTGYSFSFNKTTTNLNGMVFGINILIGGKEFYDDFTIGF